ncbi:MAG: MMPL family transporter [Candidatus Thiodiazotropha sp.]
MRRLITLAGRHPRWVIATLAAITLAAMTQLADLRLEITAEGMMVDHPESLAVYEQNLETFGSDTITVVYLEDKDLMTPGNLAAIRQALREIEAIPQVSHTTSLFSIRYLRDENGFTHTSPYLHSVPNSKASAEKISDAALLNPLVERNLLSRDGTVMAINVYLEMADYQSGLYEAVSAALDAAIAPLQSRLRQVFHLGDPSIRSAIGAQIRNDLKSILPLSLSVLMLTLWVVFRQPFFALIPLLTAGLSVIWTLGAMAFLAIPVNVMTSIIPALLISIGSTEDVHLISEYQSGIQRGLSAAKATFSMASHKGTAIFLTFFTTCLGFLSISLNRIDLLQQFGLVAAIGLGFNFIITATLVPACLQGLSLRAEKPRPEKFSVSVFSATILSWIDNYPRQLLIGLALLTACCGYWATQIEINNNVMQHFPSSSTVPDQAELIHSRLSGLESLIILLNGSDEAFLKTRNLKQLQLLQHHLEETGQFDKSFSFADFIAVVHSGIDAGIPGKVYLPESDEVIGNYMSLLGHESAKPFVSEDFNQARIVVRHAIGSSRQLNRLVEDILAFAHNHLDPYLDIKVTGSSYLNSQAVDYMAEGQTRSLILMLGVIFLLITLLLANARLASIAVVSNLFPIIVLFGVMGYSNIALDTGTVMVAAIALGICVDHSMHFVVRYQRLLDEGATPSASLSQTIRQESKPIIITASALTLGFSTLAFSAFPPVLEFGLLSALVMLLALIGTFILTPLLLRLSTSTKTTDNLLWYRPQSTNSGAFGGKLH